MPDRSAHPDDPGPLRVAPHAHARDFEGETVLLDLAGGKYYALDELGGRLWRGLLEGKTVTAIADELAPDYDVDRATLEGDLLALTHELLDAGLLVPA
jgi:hypothetical protein